MNPLRIALWINIIILTPIVLSIINNSKYITESYGLHTTSRDILLSIYLTFLLLSFYFVISAGYNVIN
jgi:hypothetical protein